jgi:TetR/AcrR family transcriptional regulator
VLQVAEEVFAECGYVGARMEEVAARAGIRRASLVHYFPDKASLYEALLDDLFGDLPARYEAAIAGPGSPMERLLRCIDVWADQVGQRPGLLHITLWEMARARPGRPVPLASRVGPIVQLFAEFVTAGQREGVFNDVDPIAFVMSVAGTTAFLGLRSNLLTSAVAPSVAPGALKAELRNWAARILVREG